MPLVLTIRSACERAISCASPNRLSPHITRSTFGIQHGEVRTTGQESGEFISAVADVSESSFILAHNTVNIDELEAAKDTLEAVGGRAASSKGAVARASSLGYQRFCPAKVSSYLPLQRASASELCPLIVMFLPSRTSWLYRATPFSE